MEPEKARNSILKAVRDRVRKSEEHQLIQLIADAIGERRYRDLGDLVSEIEQEKGWTTAIDSIARAKQFLYKLPIGVGPNETKIEDMKYREMVFTLFGCEGYEPINLSTEEILSNLKQLNSHAEASQYLLNESQSLAIEQVESGDCLFFNQLTINSSISSKLSKLLEKTQQEKISNLILAKKGEIINILPLWYIEAGREVLSQLGIKGHEIDTEIFEVVISVLHHDIRTENTEKIENLLVPPSNQLYEKLLLSTINHDIETLTTLSSRQSYSLLRFIVQYTLDQYEKDPTSHNFRNFLSSVNIHLRIRAQDSIRLLGELISSKDSRIATTAIIALGNFYHEAAASTLVDYICNNKNQNLIDIAVRAIKNLNQRCFETKYVVRKATEQMSCINSGRMKQLSKQIWTRKDSYYS